MTDRDTGQNDGQILSTEKYDSNRALLPDIPEAKKQQVKAEEFHKNVKIQDEVDEERKDLEIKAPSSAKKDL